MVLKADARYLRASRGRSPMPVARLSCPRFGFRAPRRLRVDWGTPIKVFLVFAELYLGIQLLQSFVQLPYLSVGHLPMVDFNYGSYMGCCTGEEDFVSQV